MRPKSLQNQQQTQDCRPLGPKSEVRCGAGRSGVDLDSLGLVVRPSAFLVPVTAHWEQFSSAVYVMSGISNMFLEVVGDVL